MKNTLKPFIILFSCLGVLFSCSDNKTWDEFASTISLDKSELTFVEQNAETQTVKVTADGYWVAVTPEWLSATPNHGTGNTTVEIAATDNIDTDGTIGGTRSATVSFEVSGTSASLDILQNGDPDKDLRRTYKKATKVTSGKAYLLVSTKDGAAYKAAMPNSNNYGYISSADVTIVNEEIEMPTPDNGFTFTKIDGGYTIQQSDGRYIYNSGSYNNFNYSSDIPKSGHIFTVEVQSDGTMKITCVSTGKWIQYGDGTYTSFGVYDTEKAHPIFLYEETK